MAAYDLRNIIRARGVNELLTFLRWAAEDAPGALAEILREIVQRLTQPELEELADAIIRLERRGGGR